MTDFTDADTLPKDEWVCRCSQKPSVVDKLAVLASIPRGFYYLDPPEVKPRIAVYYCSTCKEPFEFFQDTRFTAEFGLDDVQARKLLALLKRIYE